MRVHIVDPPAFTPPYDRALCAALARAGCDVELISSPFSYSDLPEDPLFRSTNFFYRYGSSVKRSGLRQVIRGVQHLSGMLRYRGYASNNADIVHYQWLALPEIDTRLLAPQRPRLLTAHDVLPREPRRGQKAAQQRLYELMDAIVVHSQNGAQRLRDELEIDPATIHHIPHGVFGDFDNYPADASLPPELPEIDKPVVLFFGLMRPYKGLDVLIDAWSQLDQQDGSKQPEPAELWVVGMPRMDTTQLKHKSPANVRWVERYVTGSQLAATFRRADLVVLPYREIDQSGVLFTAMAFGKPMVLSAVGGFPEVAALGAAELVEPGDAGSLAASLHELLTDDSRRAHLRQAALKLAAPGGPHAWDTIAKQTLSLYERLLEGSL